MPPMAKRFLLPQEWSTCVRGIVGGFGIVAAAKLSPESCRPGDSCFTQEWSCGGRECVGEFWYYWQHMTVRFLPTQEWSCGGRECVGEFWYCCWWGTGELLANTILSPPIALLLQIC